MDGYDHRYYIAMDWTVKVVENYKRHILHGVTNFMESLNPYAGGGKGGQYKNDAKILKNH